MPFAILEFCHFRDINVRYLCSLSQCKVVVPVQLIMVEQDESDTQVQADVALFQGVCRVVGILQVIECYLLVSDIPLELGANGNEWL